MYKKKSVNRKLVFTKAINTEILLNLFKNSLSKFNNNVLILNIKNLNILVKKSIFLFFYKKMKKFIKTIFSRRFNLFIDFIKFSSFFSQSKINSDSYLYLLGQIFKVLPKRKHSRFIFFLKLLFKMIVEKAPAYFDKQNLKTIKIKGIKFIINGKLQGKTRADSISIQVGSVPIQSIGKNVDFSRLHVYTIYGAFGFQMWVYRD
jgi:hypothetical protein